MAAKYVSPPIGAILKGANAANAQSAFSAARGGAWPLFPSTVILSFYPTRGVAVVQKLFGVGLARTGTTSLHQAVGHLGLRSAPSSARLIDGLDEEFLASFDAFFDNPIPFLRSELQSRFPNALFVVTWRPVDPWLTSMEWLFGPGLDRLAPELRELGDRVHRFVYGIDHFDAAVLTAIHHRHYEALRAWSTGRDDVLWLDQTAGFSWEPLCRFLDLPVPNVPFPVANASTAAPEQRVGGFLARLRRRGEQR